MSAIMPLIVWASVVWSVTVTIGLIWLLMARNR